jgi:TRAP-type C4-dicarboxylate transport system substrate-binding protein
MRNMKWEILVCLAMMLILTLVVGACAQPAPTTTTPPTQPPAQPPAQPIAINFAGYWPPTNSAALAYIWWASEIEKRTGNKVKFNFYWNGTLLPPADIPSGTGKGVAQCAAIVGSFTGDLFPLNEVANSYYVTPSPESGGKALWELHKSGYAPLVSEYDKLNLKVVGCTPGGTHIWLFKDKKVVNPSDAAGLKIRATGRNQTLAKMMGGTPVSMPPADIYEALSRGTIDSAASLTMDSLYTLKLFEPVKYLVCPQGGGIIINVQAVFNKDTWNKFPKDVQDIIMNMGNELADKNRDLIVEVEAKQAKEIAALPGKSLYKLPPDALQQWKDMTKTETNDYLDQLVKKGLTNAKEVYNKYVETAKKYEKDYKWVDPF